MYLKNRILASVLLVLLIAGNSLTLTAKKSVWSKTNMNREWKFQLGDFQRAKKTDFVDNTWQNIGLPHSVYPIFFLPSSIQDTVGTGKT